MTRSQRYPDPRAARVRPTPRYAHEPDEHAHARPPRRAAVTRTHGMATRVIRWRGEQARLGTWRRGDATAYLTPFPDTPPLSARFLEYSLARMRDYGYRAVVTAALAPGESLGFVDAGFRLHEELCLLEHDLRSVPRGRCPTRRARRTDRLAVVELDGRCFNDFWHIDEDGLEEALTATPWSRFRVVETAGRLAGYAISGRAGSRGYLQRLAVDPDLQRRGVGTALVADALRWMRRRGVRRTLVNTHRSNEAALRLYEACGFRLLPTTLRIFARTV